MASPLQQASIRRKVIYLGVIIALFTTSIFWRGKFEVPFGNRARAAEAAPTALNRVADRAARGTILHRAENLDLRELDQGDPDIAGSVARFSMVGFRGVVVTALWRAAIEKQKRNEFHEFEMLVRTVTRLQPNFITPWIFQSWNIAYNVSVENDKLGDMYFYIARGIELLSEGDRLNTKVDRRPGKEGRKLGSPDIRYQIGFYYQNKFGVSDKVQTLRCLMQLSCIPPGERQRSSLENSRGEIDPAAFRQFCEKNPQLVRRLRNKINCAHPEDVRQFLIDNDKVPSLYKNKTDLADANDQFPSLPPQMKEWPLEYYPGLAVNDSFDAFHAGRAWFLYALTVVPPPTLENPPTPEHPEGSGRPLPWSSPEDYDRFSYRMPRSPALILFRQQGPRAASYLAERLAKEGWFDETSTWNPSDDPTSGGGSPWPNAALQTPSNSRSEWRRASDMWNEHAEKNALTLSGPRIQDLQQKAGTAAPSAFPPDVPDHELLALGWTPEKARATKALLFYGQNRQMTNFVFFQQQALTEQHPITVDARKKFWEAEQAERRGGITRVDQLFVEANAKWREVLRRFPDFHRPERSEATEEATHEFEMLLIMRLKDDGGVLARVARTVATAQGLYTAVGEVPRTFYTLAIAEDEALARIAAETIVRTLPQLPTPTDDEKDAMGAVATNSELVTALSPAGAAALSARSPDAIPLAVARGLVDTRFWWMKEFMDRPMERGVQGNYELSKYWVIPQLREAVKNRMGLIRRSVMPGTEDPSAPGSGS